MGLLPCRDIIKQIDPLQVFALDQEGVSDHSQERPWQGDESEKTILLQS